VTLDYWLAVPLVGIALTVLFWLWVWFARPQGHHPRSDASRPGLRG
jgi:hypothetical protein